MATIFEGQPDEEGHPVIRVSGMRSLVCGYCHSEWMLRSTTLHGLEVEALNHLIPCREGERSTKF